MHRFYRRKFPTEGRGCKEESPVLSVTMKCFNCNPDLSELEVVKPEDSGIEASYSPVCLEPSCNDCVRNHERLSFIDSPIVGHDNKENQRVQNTLDSSNETEELEASRLYEDSGYSSFTQSDRDDGILILENFRNSPQARLLPSQSPDQHPNKTLLPVLHFERVVCSTLKKNGKRNPKVDREMLKEVIASGNFRLQNIIGKKMGLEHLDILAELSRRGFVHLLANILTKLSGMDLVNLSKVSRIWKKILENNKGAFQLYSKTMQRVIVAKTLKNNESLKACVRCNFPAKYDHYLERAVCKRESCQFEYCTKCLCAYHNNKDCLNGKILKASCKVGPLPGTKKSKKNLQRL